MRQIEPAICGLLGIFWAVLLQDASFAGEEGRRPAEGDPATTRMLEAFQRQAEGLQPSKQKPGTDAALEKLTAEIEAKRAAWEIRIERDLGQEALLSEIPAEIRTKANEFAGDSEKTAGLLKDGVSLPMLLALAAKRNPDARAAFENLRSSTRRFAQAAYLEELVAQYRAFVRELDTKVGPQSHKEMPEKAFAFPSALALKGQLVDQETELARLRYLEALRKALNDTARGSFGVQFADRRIPILKENREIFARMEAIATEQLKVGRASQADSLKAQSELAMIENQLVTAERERANAVARVNALLALAPDNAWGTLQALDLQDVSASLPESLDAARSTNQSLLRAVKEAELMETMVRMAETEVLPRGSAGYSQLAPSSGAEAGPTRSMMAAFPERPEIGAARAGFGANAAYLDEVRIRVQEARRMRESTAAMTDFMVKDAHFMADAMRRERKTLEEAVVPKTRLAVETVREKYNTGGTPFIEYLDAARSYLNNSLSMEQARRDHNRSLIDLQDACGRSAAGILPRKP